MNRHRKLVFGFVLLLALAGAGVEHRLALQQRDRLDAHNAAVAGLQAAAQSERQVIATAEAEIAALEAETAAARLATADAEARSAMTLWANRIALLRKLLEEMPAQSLPELRLLDPTDWVHVVRNRELDSAANIHAAFTVLRATARRKMAEKLQEAIKGFTTASGGELPTEIGQIAAYLSAPADREMLQRYSLLRSGPLGDKDEAVFRETATSDMISTVGLNSWHFANNPDWEPPSGESETAALARMTAAFETIFEHVEPGGAAGPLQLFKMESLREMAETLGPQMDALFGDGLGDELKAAAKRFGAERNGAAPEHLGELAPYLKNFDQLITIARPILAELEYMRDHQGNRHTDPAQLRRYLEKPLDQMNILRELKLIVEGESLKMNFSFNADSK